MPRSYFLESFDTIGNTPTYNEQEEAYSTFKKLCRRRPRTRRSQITCCIVGLCCFALGFFWPGTGRGNVSIAQKSNHISASAYTTAAYRNQSPLGHTSTNGPHRSGASTDGPILHVLIPVSETSANLCKTLYSTMLLDYPAPTLINFGHKDTEINVAYTAKIRGVATCLQKSQQMEDDDLVLMIDGYDVWFQLPPSLLISRFQSQIHQSNERLRRKFGTKTGSNSNGQVSRITEKIAFGADKLCWPNALTDPACAAVPESPLPADSWGEQTDKHPLGFENRPKWLNSGTIMGKVSDMRELYRYAMNKIDVEGRGSLGDQFVFGEIFGEQEYQREILRQNISGTWSKWLASKLGTPDGTNISATHMDAVPGRNYEYGIGIDYESQLFFTMTHSNQDVDWLRFNDTDTVSKIQALHAIPNPEPISLPRDIKRQGNPFDKFLDANRNAETNADIDEALDILPDRDALTWAKIPLATNAHSKAVSTILHFNGEKGYINKWWPRMWYHPWARALLRSYMRTASSPTVEGGDIYDLKFGRGTGDVWTVEGEWMKWSEVCHGFEEETFGDGKGKWLKEGSEPSRGKEGVEE